MKKPVVVFSVTTPVSIRLFGYRLKRLVEAGVDLHVLVGEPIVEAIPELPSEVSVHVVPLKRGIDPLNDARALIKTTRLLRKIQPRLVAAATPKASLITLLAARFSGVPIRVWEVWGAKWDGPPGKATRLLKGLDRRISRSATSIAPVSSSLADLLLQEGVIKKRPQILGRGSTKGVDENLYRPTQTASNGRKPTLGFVGRISKDKGIDDLIASASIIRTKYPLLELVLVGEVDLADPPPEDTIQQIASASWIRKTGWVPSTAPFYKDLDVFVFPSVREGLPNVILEAASCGIPSVAYDAVGTRDALLSGETGFLVPIGNRNELTKRTLQLLGSSKTRTEMGLRARRMIEQAFRQSQVEDAWTRYYLGLLTPVADS